MTDRNDRIFRNAGAIADRAERTARHAQALQVAALVAAIHKRVAAWRERILEKRNRARSRPASGGDSQPLH